MLRAREEAEESGSRASARREERDARSLVYPRATFMKTLCIDCAATTNKITPWIIPPSLTSPPPLSHSLVLRPAPFPLLLYPISVPIGPAENPPPLPLKLSAFSILYRRLLAPKPARRHRRDKQRQRARRAPASSTVKRYAARPRSALLTERFLHPICY